MLINGGLVAIACPRCLTAWHEYGHQTWEYKAVVQAERSADLVKAALMGKMEFSEVQPGDFSSEAVLTAKHALFKLSVEFFKPNQSAREANLYAEAALGRLIQECPE
jgi:hypothetical protein